MKKKKAKRATPSGIGAGKTRSSCRHIVLVEQGPLRRKAATECSREMARLERARVEWKRFEMEDKAAFARWEAATFGPLLSRLREIESGLHEKLALVQAVEFEMFFGGSRSPQAAYARINRERENPPPAAGSQGEEDAQADPFAAGGPSWGGGADTASDDFMSEEEIEEVLIFEDYLFYELGLDPSRMSDARYDRMFDEFRAGRRKKSGAKASRPADDRPSEPWSHPAPPVTKQDRVKELYRLLVRRLHPDMRADSSTEVSALWHEVQEAYSKGNVERLEMLLAFTDIQSKGAGEQTSLSQMRAVLAELRRSYNALQKNLRAAKKEPAWNFNRRDDREDLEHHLRWKLETAIAQKFAELRHLETLIASWAAPVKGQGKKKGKPGAPRAGKTQVEFPF